MKKVTRSFWAMAALMLLSVATIAQTTIKGVVVDGSTKESLPGASIVVPGTTAGIVSDFDGSFVLKVPADAKKIVVSFIGYLDREIVLNGTTDLGTIKMEADAVGLNEVKVMASVITDRTTPVAVSTVSEEVIENKLGSQEYPEILKTTPSIYTSKEGGGFGDATVYVRGFDSNNVGVLINGIPVNDMENGKVYWSNWAGLSDVSRTMQVQRGLGASKLGLSSVGGTINILTKGTSAKKGGIIKTNIGNSGYRKQLFTVSTGLMDNGWAVTLLGSHTYGNGYIKGTNFDAWSYFANISKKINDQHTLSFMITGAPQWHNQRGNKHTIEQYRNHKDEFRFNSDYGVRDGKIYGGAYGYNFYHKPQAQLNHYWKIDNETTLTTSLYGSIGSGGGRRVSGNKSGWLKVGRDGVDSPEIMRTGDGLLDFDAVAKANATYVAEGSQAIIGNSVNKHTWVGLLSSFNKTINNIKVTGGFDGRYYIGEHYQEIDDLLGGKFYLDSKNKNRPADTWLKKGDIYNYHNDGKVLYTGLFGQAEYVGDDITAFLSVAGARKSYQRVEYFKEEGGTATTDWQNFYPWNVKGGISYKINGVHTVFANGGYVQRTPYFTNVFLNYSNRVNKDVKYEKIITAELGYKFQSPNFNATVTAYRTQWKDRGLVRSYNDAIANISGLNQLHQGIEVEARYKPTSKLTIEAMLSIGDWTYEDDVHTAVFDDSQKLIGEFNAYIKGVHVGNSAQTSASVSVSYEVLPKLRINADYLYYGNHYANFDAIARNNANFKGDSWKMPEVGLVDLGANYRFKIGNLNASVFGHVHNLFDTEYVSKAQDGKTHTANDSYVFYGFGTTWSAGLKVKF